MFSDLGDVGPLTSSSSSTSCSSSAGTMKRPNVESSFPRLECGTGIGLKATAPQVETPSKRTKKTDKAKLLRTVRNLNNYFNLHVCLSMAMYVCGYVKFK